MTNRTALALAAVLLSANAMAINKCVDKAGKVTFSDTGCPTDADSKQVKVMGAGKAFEAPAKPATPEAQATANKQPITAQTSAGDRLKAELALMERDRRKRDLILDIAKLDAEHAAMPKMMQAEIDKLKAKKDLARNNQAGATWENSISTEMQAIAASYEIKMKVNRDQAAAAQKELDGLK